MSRRQRAAPVAARHRRRAWAFAALCVACLLIPVGYVAGRARPGAAADQPAGGQTLAALRGRPALLFRSLVPGDGFGALAAIPLDEPERERTITQLRCDRVHFAGGRGLCLSNHIAAFWSPPTAQAFDLDLHELASFPVPELPSRARVAPDGQHAAMTHFVRGDSYNDSGFSTRTALLDLAAGSPLGDLEQFAVWREGARFQAPDFNFWGVTFARDGNRFYATLASGGTTYLVEGDLAARSVRTLRENVECPSLSPDNRRIAFKKRVSPEAWRLHVLDLDTMAESPLAEERSVDDQAEWLDDDQVLYGLTEQSPTGTSTNVWVVPVEGEGAPRIFVPLASSPAVVRSG